MSIINNAANKNQTWNTHRLIKLSKTLEQGYGLGFEDKKSNQKADVWTTDKFIEMSRSLSSAYGVDF